VFPLFSSDRSAMFPGRVGAPPSRATARASRARDRQDCLSSTSTFTTRTQIRTHVRCSPSKMHLRKLDRFGGGQAILPVPRSRRADIATVLPRSGGDGHGLAPIAQDNSWVQLHSVARAPSKRGVRGFERSIRRNRKMHSGNGSLHSKEWIDVSGGWIAAFEGMDRRIQRMDRCIRGNGSMYSREWIDVFEGMDRCIRGNESMYPANESMYSRE
jgi:hypothetical protein